LVAANKPLVVLFPIPHGAAFGVLDAPGATSKALLESALLALYAEKKVAAQQSFAPTLTRLALAAWSSGTDTLFKWVSVGNKSLDFVDELYVFDGKRGYPVDFEAWFNADPQRRRLRLVGSAYTEVAANQLAKRLSGPNVFVHPGDPKYWYQNADYHRSLRRATDPVPLRFRSAPSASALPADASTLTNLFVQSESVADRGAFVEAKITFFSPRFGVRTIGNVAHEEAAMFAVLEQLNLPPNSGNPIASAAEFAALTQWIDQQPGFSEPIRSFRHRHSWSVIGGLFNDKGRPFVGYFQLCLEGSGFV
jgi:hypothetical protein